MKKILIIFLILIISSVTNVNADTSKSSIVMETSTGRILYENNINEKRLIASITKIMTAILTIEKADLKDIVTVGDEILTMYGTNIYLEVGEKISVQDLLYGLILRSGNDAAIVLATYIGGSEENFVKMMNEKAKLLDMQNTYFQNSHGLDDYTENISTAHDMAKLSSYAEKNKTYKKIIGTKKYNTTTEKKSYLWYNRNKLLSLYENCTGGKNGYTPKAGRTLITTAKKNNMELTIVTLNDNNEYDTHIELYNKAYSKYKMYKIIDKNNFKISNELYEGEVKIKESFFYPLTKSEKKLVSTKVILDKAENNILGHIKIEMNKNTIGIINIYKREIKKENQTIFFKIKNYLLDILKKLKLGRQNNLNPGPLVPIPLEIKT